MELRQAGQPGAGGVISARTLGHVAPGGVRVEGGVEEGVVAVSAAAAGAALRTSRAESDRGGVQTQARQRAAALVEPGRPRPRRGLPSASI